MAPFGFESHLITSLVALGIGTAFGFVLERSGFGNSRNLAAQFYLHDMRVLKVMFTAIVTAMVVLFAASAVGLVDYGRLWVPPTYMGSAVVGGLMLGFGFIIGGYCPGTSLVSMATLKKDGAMFVAGVLFGILVFGHTVTVEPLWNFYHNAGDWGRLSLGELVGIDAGWVVLGVVLMAVGAFWAAEQAERFFSTPEEREADPSPRGRLARRGAVVAAVALAVVAILVGQPSVERRVAWNEAALDRSLAERQAHLDPAELLTLMHNNQVQLTLVDVRDEADFNRFHLIDAERVSAERLVGDWGADIRPDQLVVVVSNDEAAAEQAWKRLAVRPNVNAYILAGGVNRWLDLYRENRPNVPDAETPAVGDERLRHRFAAVLGSRHASSRPEQSRVAERAFTPKAKLLGPVRASGGGCG